MPAKKKTEPVVGQRSISAFFSAKPKAAQADSPAAAASPAKLLKPGPAADVSCAKATVADGTTAQSPPRQVAPPAASKKRKAAPKSGASAKAAPKSGATAKAPGGCALGPDDVGKSVRVYWPDDDAWYLGDIKELAPASSRCLVQYDDGDEEWVDLGQEKWSWADRAADKRKHARAAGRKRKAAVVESDSEGDGAASGSEYAVSEEEGVSSDDDASLASEEGEEEEEELSASDSSPAAKGRKRSGGKPAAPSGRGRAAAARGGGAKAAAAAAATPVAVNGSVGLTPGSAAAASGLPTAARASGASTAARPPRPSLPAKTPGTGATSAPLARLLDGGTPMTGRTGAGGDTPASALREDAAPRFSGRDLSAFAFLHPDNIRDAQRRRPDHPDYDPRTLFIPPNWFKEAKVSPGQQQWWEFKARHYDAILLFKMGKFYELFEMDAHLAVETLGLSYMKGEKPHAGFPEASYHEMAERLARAGHKVVVVEQTETPDMLKTRNEERTRQGLKKETVVRRERVAVLTQGTLTDAEMLGGQPEAAYLMALAELAVPPELMAASEASGAPPAVWVGACAVDAATGQVLLGQWLDDELRSQLRAVLTAVQPVELVVARGELSAAARKVARGILRAPRFNELPLGDGDGQFWDAYTVWHRLDEGGYWPEGAELPPALAAVQAGGAAQAAAAHALGGCLSHLRDVLLDKQVLAAGRVEQLGEVFGIGAGLGGSGGGGDAAAGSPQYMALDGAALENLEVLENSEGGTAGTLLAAVNNCVTPAGRRRLRQWLCRPLARIPDIEARQDAVAALMGPAEEAAAAARTLFKGVADLERDLARITAAGQGAGAARDAPHVILYEDVARRRVKAYAAALRGLQHIQDAAAGFQALGDAVDSALLRRLVTPGELFPDMAAALGEMQAATDWAAAEASGRVEPARGVDGAYDAALDAEEAAEAALGGYLQEARRAVGAGVRVQYVSVNKESHVLEVPEGAPVPASWELTSQRKGVKRYVTEELRGLVRAREAAAEAKERAQGGILQGMMRGFAARKALWAAAVDCMAQLDALMSLAVAAACGAGTMCRPRLLPWSPGDGGAPLLRARALRHPAGLSGRDGTFVPNDVELGGPHAPPFIVLTGPNMGGKSTLMRQVCLAALLAQVGAWVPAEGLELCPADAVFVRQGARDRILLGQSTFLVELSETSAALHRATPSSLVILDELGRGTSTGDGAAIAAAVLDHLTARVGCRGLFATHYHHIADSHASDPRVAIKHMGCAVAPPAQPGGVEEVTFLYRLTDGACPKSYGANVARLAGLPDSVVARAAAKAHESEEARHAAAAAGGDGGNSGGAGGARQLLQRAAAACRAAVGGEEGAAAAVLRLQDEVRRFLRLD